MTRVSVNQGRPTFLRQRSTPVIEACWFTGLTWKIHKGWASSADLCLRVGDPCRKLNCTLNRSLCTLQLSCSFCCCVITECAVAWQVKVENFHLFQSLRHYQCNSELWGNLFSALCHVVCSYYICIKTAHKLG